MRKFIKHLFIFTLVSSVVLLTSCGDDDSEEVAPVLTVEISGADIAQTQFDVGEEVNLTVGFVSEAELAGLSYVVTVNGIDLPVEVISFSSIGLGNTETSGSFNFSLPISASLAGAAVTLTMTAEDKTSQTANDSFSFTVSSVPSVEIYSAFLLAAPLGDGSSQTFFSTTTGEKYTYNGVMAATTGVSANIDFGYYYGVSKNATLAGIDAYPTSIVNVDAWNTQNITLFRTTTMTAAEFDALTEFDSDDIAAEFEVGTAESGEKTLLSAGNVLAFKTDATKTGGSKFGLVKIVSVQGTDGASDGINIAVKVNL